MQLNSETQFDKDYQAGCKGETIVLAWLLKNEKVKSVIDASKDKRYQKYDIDYIVQFTDMQLINIEIKTDFQADKTNNIAYEIISNVDYNSKGCFEKTKSDYIFYYIYNSHDLLIADTNKLKQYVKDNSKNLKLIPMGENARGYLININELIKGKIITKYGGII